MTSVSLLRVVYKYQLDHLLEQLSLIPADPAFHNMARRPGPPMGRTKNGRSEYAARASADRGLLKEVIDMDLGS